MKLKHLLVKIGFWDNMSSTCSDFTHSEVMKIKTYIMNTFNVNSRQVFVDIGSEDFRLDYLTITFVDAPRKRTACVTHFINDLSLDVVTLPPFKYARKTPTVQRKYRIKLPAKVAMSLMNFLRKSAEC